MDVLKAANEREMNGKPVFHMEVGQPSSAAPKSVREAAKVALDNDKLGYTEAMGLPSLRAAIAQHYQRTTLLVENLVCTSCLGLIEESFQKIPGVVGMTADLKSGTVTADHIERIPGQQFAETVTKLGYPASVVKAVINIGRKRRAEASIIACSNSMPRSRN